MKNNTQIYLCFLCLINWSCNAQQPTKTLKELDNKIETLFSKSKLPGFSVVIVDDKEVLYQTSLGFADLESNKRFTNHTVKNIASVSKTFIGVALMKAVEQGKIDLDADINRYLPFKVSHPKFLETPITLRHLATHTSSIDDEPTYSKSYVIIDDSYDFSRLPKKIAEFITPMKTNKKIDDSQFLKNVLSKEGIWYSKQNFTKKKPGKEYHYSNIGASLAAYVLENAVGMSYEDYTKEYILNTLEMNQSGWNNTDVDMSDYAIGYFTKKLPVPRYHLITKADGALMTSTTDFGKYLIEMLKGCQQKGTILSPKSYDEMFTRIEFGGESSGIFWGVSASGKPNHSGSDPGVITITSINPKKNLAVFFISNIDIDVSKYEMKSIIKILNTLKIHNWN